MTGKEIRGELLIRGTLLKDVALELGVSKQLVSNVVNGLRKSAKVQHYIAKALGKSYAEVWGAQAA